MAAAVGYVRVSSRALDHATQVAAIERAAHARGDTIGHVYAEKRSGKTIARPELDRLRADARAGKIGRLYLFRLDRLTRSGIRDTFEVVEELRAHGCHIVTVADGFDLDGPAAEIVLAVMAWASKMERLAIGERISAARDRLEAEGRPWGRPRRMNDATIARAAVMRAEGRSVRQIAVALKIPRATITRALAQKPPAVEPAGSPRKRSRQQGAAR
jgi:DNA invertase Pin-like site-specific DNA recombinase